MSESATEIIKDILKNLWAGFKKLPLIKKLFEKGPRVAVLRLSGIIADTNVRKKGLSYKDTAKYIDKAFDRSGLKAVMLVINSPGGSPAQTALIAGHIRQLADEKELPVYAFVEDVAASGGYWLACAADEIYGLETSILGSVGVISASFGFEDFIEKHDIHRRVHTAGGSKSFMDPFLPEKKEDLKRLEELQEDIHESFISWVKQRRGDKISAKDSELFEGQIWTTSKAIDLGMADAIGDLRSVTREKYGEDVKLIKIDPSEGSFLSGLLGMKSSRARMDIADDVLNAMKSETDWSRFGLS